MARRRRHILTKVKLAATLVAYQRTLLIYLGRHAEAAEFYEHSKSMSADQIISLFQFDHDPIRHEAGGPDEPWNLTPRMIMEHRKLTAKRDRPAIARDRRIEGKWRDFHRAVAKGRKPPRRRSKWPRRALGHRGSRGQRT